MKKIRYFILAFFFLATIKVLAQQHNIQSAKNIVAQLKANEIEPILEMVDPEYRSTLNANVISQIRKAIISNGWEYYVGNYSSEPYESFDLKGEVVFAKGAAFRLAFVFKNSMLARFYIDPLSPFGTYKIPAYADTMVFRDSPIAVKAGDYILPGTLTTPLNKKKFPLLIYIHGSGSNNRDEAIFSLKPFKDIALGLAAKGIASLRYDKRNKVYSKASVPDGSFNTMDIETTDDANSVIKFAKSIPGVDSNQIYVLGHSQGGMMLPKILDVNKDVAGGIFLSAPGISLVESYENNYNNISSTTSMAAVVLSELGRIKNIDGEKDDYHMLLVQPVGFWKNIKNYDQLKVVKKLKMPLLFLQGQRDYQVSADKFDLWKEAVSNNPGAVFKLYPKLNHFYSEGNGPIDTQEYYRPANVPAYVINDISSWILQISSKSNIKNKP